MSEYFPSPKSSRSQQPKKQPQKPNPRTSKPSKSPPITDAPPAQSFWVQRRGILVAGGIASALGCLGLLLLFMGQEEPTDKQTTSVPQNQAEELVRQEPSREKVGLEA